VEDALAHRLCLTDFEFNDAVFCVETGYFVLFHDVDEGGGECLAFLHFEADFCAKFSQGVFQFEQFADFMNELLLVFYGGCRGWGWGWGRFRHCNILIVEQVFELIGVDERAVKQGSF